MVLLSERNKYGPKSASIRVMVGQRGCTGCRKNGGVGVNSGSSSGGGW